MTETVPVDVVHALTVNGRRAYTAHGLTAVTHLNRTLVPPIRSHKCSERKEILLFVEDP